MPSISFDLSDRVDVDHLRAPLAAFDAVTRELGVEFLVVGAAARDLVVLFGHGLAVHRATLDVDVAVAVSNWDAYERVRSSFEHCRGDAVHRSRIAGVPVDIVPFGGVERPDRTIVWPPDDGSVMSTFGMAEALSDALSIRLATDLLCRVASLPAQLILKLTAWQERGIEKPRHDSVDIKMLLKSYSGAWNLDRLYAEPPLLEAFDFDADLAGAALLGRDTARLVDASGAARLRRLVTDNLDEDGRLPGDMPGQRADNEALLVAYLWGLKNTVSR